MKVLFTVALLLFSTTTFSARLWTPSEGSKVEIVNPGVRSQGATYFTLEGVAFSGCTNSTGTILWKDTNNNYTEIYSLLLAAKMADKLVRIYYENSVDCDYPEIVQAYLL